MTDDIDDLSDDYLAGVNAKIEAKTITFYEHAILGFMACITAETDQQKGETLLELARQMLPLINDRGLTQHMISLTACFLNVPPKEIADMLLREVTNKMIAVEEGLRNAKNGKTA